METNSLRATTGNLWAFGQHLSSSIVAAGYQKILWPDFLCKTGDLCLCCHSLLLAVASPWWHRVAWYKGAALEPCRGGEDPGGRTRGIEDPSPLWPGSLCLPPGYAQSWRHAHGGGGRSDRTHAPEPAKLSWKRWDSNLNLPDLILTLTLYHTGFLRMAAVKQ